MLLIRSTSELSDRELARDAHDILRCLSFVCRSAKPALPLSQASWEMHERVNNARDHCRCMRYKIDHKPNQIYLIFIVSEFTFVISSYLKTTRMNCKTRQFHISQVLLSMQLYRNYESKSRRFENCHRVSRFCLRFNWTRVSGRARKHSLGTTCMHKQGYIFPAVGSLKLFLL